MKTQNQADLKRWILLPLSPLPPQPKCNHFLSSYLTHIYICESDIRFPDLNHNGVKNQVTNSPSERWQSLSASLSAYFRREWGRSPPRERLNYILCRPWHAQGFPFAKVFSISDGIPGKSSSGTPYLYMTPMDVSAQVRRLYAAGIFFFFLVYSVRERGEIKVSVRGKRKKNREN